MRMGLRPSAILVCMYQDNNDARRRVERIQTGVRLEKRLLKVTKALADSLDLTLGDLLEGVLLHVLEGKTPFGAETLQRAAQLKRVFALDLGPADAHALTESAAAPAPARVRAAAGHPPASPATRKPRAPRRSSTRRTS